MHISMEIIALMKLYSGIREHGYFTFTGIHIIGSHAIGYSSGNEWRMLEMCEEDEKLKLPLVVAGQRRSVNFVTENGLYNILAQSRMEIARSWRRVVHDELINMRKEKGRNIAEQFEEWDRAMDNIYFDEETGQLMQSVTVPGGDVIQIPYEKEEE